MDLGSSICTVRAPKCPVCPVAQDCAARELDPERFPVKAPKKAKPLRKGTAWWIERDGAVWLVTRPGRGMLGGMRALPDDGWSAGKDGSGYSPLAGEWDDPGAVSHGFTHFALELSVRRYLGSDTPGGAGEWWPIERLDEAGLPTLFAKAARRALA